MVFPINSFPLACYPENDTSVRGNYRAKFVFALENYVNQLGYMSCACRKNKAINVFLQIKLTAEE